MCLFSSFLQNVSIFFFPRLIKYYSYILHARKNLFFYSCDDAFKEQQQQQQQHATTTKESTFEKSGEREDGFEGTRERRTGVRVFEDSDDVEANHQIQKEEEEEEEEEGDDDDDVERLRRIMCVPCDDVVEQNHQMREEETVFIAKGAKRKRGHECWVCEKVFRYPSYLSRHAYSHERETV